MAFSVKFKIVYFRVRILSLLSFKKFWKVKTQRMISWRNWKSRGKGKRLSINCT